MYILMVIAKYFRSDKGFRAYLADKNAVHVTFDLQN